MITYDKLKKDYVAITHASYQKCSTYTERPKCKCKGKSKSGRQITLPFPQACHGVHRVLPLSHLQHTAFLLGPSAGWRPTALVVAKTRWACTHFFNVLFLFFFFQIYQHLYFHSNRINKNFEKKQKNKLQIKRRYEIQGIFLHKILNL